MQLVTECAYLLVLIAVIFACCFTEIKSAAVLGVYTLFLVLNIIRFVRAVKFRKAFSDKRTATCEGVIKLAFGPTGMRDILRTGHALAEYTVNSKTVKGWMIGVYDERLRPEDRVKIIVNRRCPTMFAFSEKQVRGAVKTYGIFTILGVIAAVVLAWAFVREIVFM